MTDRAPSDVPEGSATLRRLREWPLLDLTIRYLRATGQLTNERSGALPVICGSLGALNYRLTVETLPERADESGFEFFRYLQGGLSLVGMIAIAFVLFYLWKLRGERLSPERP